MSENVCVDRIVAEFLRDNRFPNFNVYDALLEYLCNLVLDDGLLGVFVEEDLWPVRLTDDAESALRAALSETVSTDGSGGS
jgi:hypothetical protein